MRVVLLEWSDMISILQLFAARIFINEGGQS